MLASKHAESRILVFKGDSHVEMCLERQSTLGLQALQLDLASGPVLASFPPR